MTKQEIVSGIKNAMLRGEPLQKAMQSFVNAGYSIPEVQEAAKVVQSQQPVTQQIQSEPIETKDGSKLPIIKPKKKLSKKMIILISLLAFMLIATGIVFFFGEKILQAALG